MILEVESLRRQIERIPLKEDNNESDSDEEEKNDNQGRYVKFICSQTLNMKSRLVQNMDVDVRTFPEIDKKMIGITHA